MSIRNLIYQICPIRDNEEWIHNLTEMLPYWGIFNGSRIVVVKTGAKFVDPVEVKKEISSADSIQWLFIENDDELHESAGFINALDEVNCKSSGLTFYAHTKGVSYPDSDPMCAPVRVWRRAMYYYCLNDVKLIERILEKFRCCGAFKKNGLHHLSVDSSWHFSGTFFWFDNRYLFGNNNWRYLQKDRYAVEGYLSRFFGTDSAYCLVGEDPDPDYLYGYSEADWLNLGIHSELLRKWID